MKYMKQELIKLLNEFVEAVNKFNHEKRLAEHTNFEDDIEVNLEQFIKWLNFHNPQD